MPVEIHICVYMCYQQAQFSAYSYAHIQYACNLLTFEDAQSINAANLVFQLCKSFLASCITPTHLTQQLMCAAPDMCSMLSKGPEKSRSLHQIECSLSHVHPPSMFKLGSHMHS